MATCYGSSILADHHNVPLHMRNVWPKGNMPPPTIVAKPGGLLDVQLIADIKKNAEMQSPNRQIIGLCCYGN